MAVNILALMSLVLAAYVIMQADKKKKSHNRLVYAVAGVILLLWSLNMLFWGFSNIANAMPLIFGLAVVGSMQTKGWTQATFGAFALLILLNVVA